MAVESKPLFAEALEANRAGRLTDTQRRNIGAQERDFRKSELWWALFALAIGAIILFVPGANPSPAVHVGIPLLCVLIAVGLAYWSLTSRDPLARDLREGRVESLEGAIGKDRSTLSSGSHDATVYFLQVGSKRFSVGRGMYDSAPEAGWVRIYYLPRSNRVVNFERSGDSPLPEISSRQEMASEVKASLSLNRLRRNEARARLQGMMDGLSAEPSGSDEQEATSENGGRPLEEAIVGTWSNIMMTVTLRADGTAEVELPGGKRQTGDWSLDASGRLHSEALGNETGAQVHLAGNRLTVSMNGMGLTFDRVG
jgi:hypothetical protein